MSLTAHPRAADWWLADLRECLHASLFLPLSAGATTLVAQPDGGVTLGRSEVTAILGEIAHC